MTPRQTATTQAIVIAGWLLAVSTLTIIRFAPPNLNADVILNGVMSLQNVTLYYWGQNRLLNLLPFTAMWVEDAGLNLGLQIGIASASFFGLLLFLAMFARRAVGGDRSLVLPVFVALSSLYLVVVRPEGIHQSALGHHEHSLAALMAAAAVYIAWFSGVRAWLRAALATPLVVLAIGLNPAMALALGPAALGAMLYRRRIDRTDAALLAVTVASFCGWTYVSSLHGASSYGALDFSRYPAQVLAAAGGLASLVNLPLLAAALAGGIAIRVVQRLSTAAAGPVPRSAAGYASAFLLLFFIGWILFFSANAWVQANAMHARYFIPAGFALLAMAALGLAALLRDARPWLRAAIVLPLAVAAIGLTATRPVPFEQYAVFRTVGSLPRPESGFYAGDYWRVWPTVFRDLMAGETAFGLTTRGEGNRKAVLRHVRAEIDRTGAFSVLCIRQPVETCVAQVREIVTRSRLKEASKVSEEADLLTMTR